MDTKFRSFDDFRQTFGQPRAGDSHPGRLVEAMSRLRQPRVLQFLEDPDEQSAIWEPWVND